MIRELIHLGKKTILKKGAFLNSPASGYSKVYYIESGMLRVYYLLDDKEITDWFGIENDFLFINSDTDSPVAGKMFVHALEDAVVWEIQTEIIEKTCETNPTLSQAYRSILFARLLKTQERIKALQFYSASEKYALLLEKNRAVAQRAPRGHIASYLGITLETLSRVSKP